MTHTPEHEKREFPDLGITEEDINRVTSGSEPISAFDRFIYENSLTTDEFKVWKNDNSTRQGVVLGIGEEHIGSVIAFAYAHKLKPFSELGTSSSGWSCETYIEDPLKKGEIVVFLLPPEKLFSHSSRSFTWEEVNYLIENASADDWENIFFVKGVYSFKETLANWQVINS